MSRAKGRTHCYVDESIHEMLGFVAVAFVFASEDLDPVVSSALVSAGLDPACEEFKSGARMEGNARMQAARQALLRIVCDHTDVAVVFAPRHHCVPIGKQCLQALQSVFVRNGIRPEVLTLHVDQGIFPSPVEADRLIGLFPFLKAATFRLEQASHVCRGIQLADLIAHIFAQIIREALTGIPKLISEEGTQIRLSVLLLEPIRYAILARRFVSEGQDFDPATDPVVLGPDDDPLEYGLHPEAFGWGVQVAPEAPEPLRRAIREMLDRVWLGCMH